MHRTTLGAATLAVAMALVGSQSRAGIVPEAINFQAQLTDNVGTPVGNGTYDLTFRIYFQNPGGVAQWTEVHNAVAVTDSLFSVQLGNISAFSAGGLVFDREYWISIEVDTDGEMSPRFKLAAAPYAITSRDSQQLGGVPAADYALAADLSTDDGAPDEAGDPVDWTKIKNIPADLADGDGGQAYLAGNGINIVVDTIEVDFGPGATQAAPGNHTHPLASGATDVTSTAAELNILDGVTASTADLNLLTGKSGTLWTSANDGPASGLNADLLDGLHEASFFRLNQAEVVTGRPAFNGGLSLVSSPFTVSSDFLVVSLNSDYLDNQHGSYYTNASNLNGGTLNNARFSAYSDLSSEGYLDNNLGTDILTRSQADTRFVNAGEASSINSTMIQNGQVTASDLQDTAALAEILDDDGPGSGLNADLLDGYDQAAFFVLTQNETVVGRPAFNGGVTGSTSPFTVDSTFRVTNLNADYLDGLSSASFMSSATDNWVNETGDTMTGNLRINARLGVGTAASADDVIYAYRPGTDYGAGRSGVYSYRVGSNLAANGGTSWTNAGVDAAITAYTLWGNNYSAAIYADSFLDFPESAALVADGGGSQAKFSYRDGSSLVWAGHFIGDVRLAGSGSDLYIGTDITTDDDTIYFDSNEYLRWDDSQTMFVFSDAVNATSLHVGSTTVTTYNYIGNPGTPAGGDMSTNGDLYVYFDLEVGSQIYYFNLVNLSSRELKKDIADLSSSEAFDALEEMTPVRFKYKKDPAAEHIGFIAEDVPDCIRSENGKGVLTMEVAAILTKAVKAQQETISKLEKRIESLEKRLEAK